MTQPATDHADHRENQNNVPVYTELQCIQYIKVTDKTGKGFNGNNHQAGAHRQTH